MIFLEYRSYHGNIEVYEDEGLKGLQVCGMGRWRGGRGDLRSVCGDL